QLSVPGAEIVAEGHVESKDGGRLDPKLDVKVEASDLRTLLAAVARTNGHAPIAAEGGWRFGRDGDGFQFDDIALMLGGTEVKGALTASALTRPILSGRLSIARMELATLLAAAIGHANDGEGFWPAER